MGFFRKMGEMIVPPKPEVEQKRPQHPYRESDLSLEALPPDHYRLPPVRPLPAMDELRKEFPGGVSEIFDGRPWVRHPVCEDIDKEKGGKIAWLVDPPADVLGSGREGIIEWASRQHSPVAPNGYRPATHEELYAFEKMHPNGSDWIVAFGSSTLGGDNRCVASVWGDGGLRFLGLHWVVRKFDASIRVLFISK